MSRSLRRRLAVELAFSVPPTQLRRFGVMRTQAVAVKKRRAPKPERTRLVLSAETTRSRRPDATVSLTGQKYKRDASLPSGSLSAFVDRVQQLLRNARASSTLSNTPATFLPTLFL